MMKFIRAAVMGASLIVVTIFGGTASALSWNDFFSSSATSSTTSQSVAQSDTDSEHPCLHFTNHEYEVCSAYVANSALAVLVPYYKYGQNNDALSRYVTYRLGSRYEGQAYDMIQSRAAQWPKGRYDVDIPQIHIVSVDSHLSDNTATLVTQESWRVTDKDDAVVYQETNQQHVITMRRVPSYILHKWVVTDIQ